MRETEGQRKWEHKKKQVMILFQGIPCWRQKKYIPIVLKYYCVLWFYDYMGIINYWEGKVLYRTKIFASNKEAVSQEFMKYSIHNLFCTDI